MIKIMLTYTIVLALIIFLVFISDSIDAKLDAKEKAKDKKKQEEKSRTKINPYDSGNAHRIKKIDNGIYYDETTHDKIYKKNDGYYIEGVTRLNHNQVYAIGLNKFDNDNV